MSGLLKDRPSSNSSENLCLSVNENILRECHLLYTDSSQGLVGIAKQLGLRLLAPRKKITVMLMGNHSAGKSSFINWYIEEHILKTGVATETQGFTFVTSGKKRESLLGNATLHVYPQFQGLEQVKGVTDYLTTEISTSKQKMFFLVTFIDTPGLVDGDMLYEFDVDKALIWLGEQADLILVFFDPMGQALCKRTLNVVEKINEMHGEKLRFYLSKADEAGHESDRQRVMMQIVQELCKRPGLNKCGFDMPTIYIPEPNKPAPCMNRIQEVCTTIEKTINRSVQNTLNQLGKDCELIIYTAECKLQESSEHASRNRRAWIKYMFFSALVYLAPLSLLTCFIISETSRENLADIIGDDSAKILLIWAWCVSTIWNWLTGGSYLLAAIMMIGFMLVSMLLAKCCNCTKLTLSRKERKQLRAKCNYVQHVVVERKERLYEMYLQQCISEQEIC
ncbi:uncharacterized protein LOC122544134 isoform X2 [Chiloscyllium plagiosum]|uniref:uncharacterized protein LOC122544134 isoform X2 n=1 Tax=Chiloscyllium plagiosum TaxID=36176 RepID=UPI001CB7C0A0|nr:uncharacterized protein LOC122544134 isoform X2 [Chiloscyllium plagiosum]